MKLIEDWLSVSFRQVWTYAVSGDISIKADFCAWNLDLLHLQCRILKELLQLRIISLICSYRGVIQKRRCDTRDVARQCISGCVVGSLDVADIRSELGDEIDVAYLSWSVATPVYFEQS